jgi:hypothetical protein
MAHNPHFLLVSGGFWRTFPAEHERSRGCPTPQAARQSAGLQQPPQHDGQPGGPEVKPQLPRQHRSSQVFHKTKHTVVAKNLNPLLFKYDF